MHGHYSRTAFFNGISAEHQFGTFAVNDSCQKNLTVILGAATDWIEPKDGVRKRIEFNNRKRPIPPLAENHQPWSIR